MASNPAFFNPHTIKRAEHHWRRSQQTASKALQTARVLCDSLGIDFQRHCLMADPKSVERIAAKTELDYHGDMSKISDGCRLMITFNSASRIADIHRMIIPGKKNSPFVDQIERMGVELTTAKDFFNKPKRWGYMGFLLKLKPESEKYVPFEIQITHAGLQKDVYPVTHTLYETIREQIEELDQNGIATKDWPEDVQSVLKEMLKTHWEGANTYGILPYIGRFPTIEAGERDDPVDDVRDLGYRVMGVRPDSDPLPAL